MRDKETKCAVCGKVLTDRPYHLRVTMMADVLADSTVRELQREHPGKISGELEDSSRPVCSDECARELVKERQAALSREDHGD